MASRHAFAGYGLPAAAALLIGLVAAIAAWYTAPIWRNAAASDDQVVASNALATRDLIALGHLDVQRAADLHARLFGFPDADALFGDRNNTLLDSLAASGIDAADAIDDAVAALYTDGDSSTWTVVLVGRLDFESIRRWLTDEYDVERVDTAARTIHFSWLDPETCEPVALKGVRVGDTHVVVSDADRIQSTWSRLQAAAPAEVGIEEWSAMTERQIVSVGIFSPHALGRTADGLAGMMLATAGQAAEPAEAIYLGVAPAMLPPGIILSGAVSSRDQAFLDRAHDAASTWLAEAKSSAQGTQPELLELYDRISVALAGRRVRAAVRLDTDLDDEIRRLVGALFRPTFRAGPARTVGGQAAPEDDVDENPVRFSNASPGSLQPYASFGSGQFEPQWQKGPFAMTVSQLGIDDRGRMQVTVKGQARGLANVGYRSRLVRLRITDAVGHDGRTLLPESECGLPPVRGWIDGRVSTGSQFRDGEIVTFPTVALEKELTLAAGVTAADVAAIRGEIEYLLPISVRREQVDAPMDGKVVEGDEVRLLFQPGSERSLSYQVSGDTRRLLAVRGLNAQGQPLTTGAAVWGGNWLGGGEHASLEINGRVAAAEVVLAEQFESLVYSFELPGAFPPMESKSTRNYSPLANGSPESLATALELAPPELTFEYNEPETTEVAGPALLAVTGLQVSSFSGLVAQLTLYVPNELPLAGRLNGSSIVLDRAVLPNGEVLPLGLASPVTLSDASAYWMNGEYRTDPDQPWLEGRAMLQAGDYEGERPAEILGHLVFRTARETTTETASAVPGTRLTAAGAEVVIAEWRENRIEVHIPSGAERVMTVEFLDSNGNVVGRADRIGGTGTDSTASVKLDGRPRTVRVVIATEPVEYEVPFSVDLAT